MIEIVLHNPKIQVGELGGDMKAIILVDPETGITVTTALDEAASQAIGAALASAGIEIAHRLPPDGNGAS